MLWPIGHDCEIRNKEVRQMTHDSKVTQNCMAISKSINLIDH
jgi:hypothetical protein